MAKRKFLHGIQSTTADSKGIERILADHGYNASQLQWGEGFLLPNDPTQSERISEVIQAVKKAGCHAYLSTSRTMWYILPRPLLSVAVP